MLSIGLRFGQGFDKMSTIKVMQSVPIKYDYDLLIVGASPGGIALAMEARAAGKRTALIRRKKYTPAEEQGFEEDLVQMARVLEVDDGNATIADLSQNFSISESVKSKRNKSEIKSSGTITSRNTQTHYRASGKIRRSRLDLNNELFKRGKECVRLMQNAASLGDLVEKASNSGWRLFATKVPLSLNWYKMTEDIMDYVMEKNYNLMNDLSAKNVRIIEGKPRFTDNHTIAVTNVAYETTITADVICIAPSGFYDFPKNIEGSAEFGISFDDFPRMTKSPGKTLVVGGTSEALECAGILASCRFPVTVVSKRQFLHGFDREITKMIIKNLKKKGVKFMENVTLRSIARLKHGRLLAFFKMHNYLQDEIVEEIEGENEEKEKSRQLTATEEFDTVLFAIHKKVNLKSLGLSNTDVQLDPDTGKIKTNTFEATAAPNIYALGDSVLDRPQDHEVSELAGKLLGRRLFHNETQLMDYSSYPVVIYTPMEYAFVGITEDSVLSRFGTDCIDVYHGFFESLDFVLFPTKEKCFAKIIVLKPSETIIGMHIVGPRAGEIIQGFAAAIKNGLTMQILQSIVGVPGTSAQHFLKLRELKSYEKMPSSSDLAIGV